MIELPSFADLPVRADAPPGSSWGLWGERDELGTLNLLNDDSTLASATAIRRGAVFALGLPLHEPDPHPGWRRGPRHRHLRVGHQQRNDEPGGADDPSGGTSDRDDYLDGLWLQASSQWDALSHVRHPRWGNYNGIADDDIGTGPGARLGIDGWARRAVVGRGLMVDVMTQFTHEGRPFDLHSDAQITVADLERTIEAQGAAVHVGDILLIRTGWLGSFLASEPAIRNSMMGNPVPKVPGLEPSGEMAAFLWDLHVAAVASDNMAVEATQPALDFPLHRMLLPLLGMPLGELWVLDPLAADCRADGRYDVFLASVPLNLRGGVGSPAQAIAIK